MNSVQLTISDNPETFFANVFLYGFKLQNVTAGNGEFLN